jgi:hypothetical protein
MMDLRRAQSYGCAVRLGLKYTFEVLLFLTFAS